jgi:hypothetical protein
MPILLSMLAALALAPAEPAEAQPDRCLGGAPGWLHPRNGTPEHRLVLEVRLRGRIILWEGQPVSRRALRKRLARSRRMDPAPFVVLDAGGAGDCARARHVRRAIDRALRCGRDGLCGLGARRDWQL